MPSRVATIGAAHQTSWETLRHSSSATTHTEQLRPHDRQRSQLNMAEFDERPTRALQPTGTRPLASAEHPDCLFIGLACHAQRRVLVAGLLVATSDAPRTILADIEPSGNA